MAWTCTLGLKSIFSCRYQSLQIPTLLKSSHTMAERQVLVNSCHRKPLHTSEESTGQHKWNHTGAAKVHTPSQEQEEGWRCSRTRCFSRWNSECQQSLYLWDSCWCEALTVCNSKAEAMWLVTWSTSSLMFFEVNKISHRGWWWQISQDRCWVYAKESPARCWWLMPIRDR